MFLKWVLFSQTKKKKEKKKGVCFVFRVLDGVYKRGILLRSLFLCIYKEGVGIKYGIQKHRTPRNDAVELYDDH